MKEERREGFPPIVNHKTNILILGTFPAGKLTRKKKEYYADDKKNPFWKILGGVFDLIDLESKTYKEKKSFLYKNKIGIWDIIQSHTGQGSPDSNIKNPIINNFENFFKKHPSIKIIIFNKENVSKKYLKLMKNKRICFLPSSSGANTHLNLKKKLKIWRNSLRKIIK